MISFDRLACVFKASPGSRNQSNGPLERRFQISSLDPASLKFWSEHHANVMNSILIVGIMFIKCLVDMISIINLNLCRPVVWNPPVNKSSLATIDPWLNCLRNIMVQYIYTSDHHDEEVWWSLPAYQGTWYPCLHRTFQTPIYADRLNVIVICV